MKHRGDVKLREGWTGFHEVLAGFFVRRVASAGWEASPYGDTKLIASGRSKAEAIGQAYLELESKKDLRSGA